ncbi:hypothetical protein EMERY_85 [Brevibacillus phage Emery]|nr:hypothetical protein EMERY_85 [Brevibacillus phage Emery]
MQERISDIENILDDSAYYLELWNKGKHPEQMDV